MQSYSRHTVWVGVAVAAVVLAGSATLMGAGAKTAKDGVYSEAQATRGEPLYKDKCGFCHGDDMSGSSAPGLAGDEFLGRWDKAPVLELVSKIQGTMPYDAPGSLSKEQSVDITAFILKTNKYPAGADLPADDEAQKAITLVK